MGQVASRSCQYQVDWWFVQHPSMNSTECLCCRLCLKFLLQFSEDAKTPSATADFATVLLNVAEPVCDQ